MKNIITWIIEDKEEDYVYTGYIGKVRTCLLLEKYSDNNCWLFHDKSRYDGEHNKLGGHLEVLEKEVKFEQCKEIAEIYCEI